MQIGFRHLVVIQWHSSVTHTVAAWDRSCQPVEKDLYFRKIVMPVKTGIQKVFENTGFLLSQE
jgi:hypothetical protein